MEPQKKKKKKKRLCSYNKSWEINNDWLAPTNDSQEAKCILCRTTFKIGYMGILALTQHKNSGTHKLAQTSVNSSNLIDNFLVRKNTTEQDLVIAAEISQIYHAVKHHHSYNSLDCSMKLNSKVFNDSILATKLSCGRTKSEAIVCNVLGRKALQVVLDDIKHHDPPLFYCIQIVASNQKNMKMFPVSVQYFSKEYGKVNYLIDFFENADESADGMFEFLKNSMSSLGLDWNRVSSFSADNAYCNFGRNHSLFTNIQAQNEEVIKANCHAHILHNTLKLALGNLDIDIENIILKIYGHFSISAKRHESLKEFHLFVETEFREILRHVPTRWLSLQPCIERILISWKALSSYFLSTPKDCPKQVFKLLLIDDDSTEIPIIVEIYLLFSQHAIGIFRKAIYKLENNETSAGDVYYIFTDLKNKLENRYNEEFFGYQVCQYLKKLDATVKGKIIENFKLFYSTALKYLKEKFDFSRNSCFGILSNLCFQDNACPKYEAFIEVVEDFKMIDKLGLNMDDLFDELSILQTNFEAISNTKSFKNCLSTAGKWHLILKSNGFKCINIFKVVSYALSVPGTSVYCERIFSVMNAKWRDDRNRCSVELIKSELLIYFNLKDNCADFASKIKNDTALLKAGRSQDKYNFINK